MRYKLLCAVIVLKLALLVIWFLAGPASLETVRTAMAGEAAQGPASGAAEMKTVSAPEPARNRSLFNPDYEKEKGLLEAIARRREELDAREEELRARRERIEALEEDVEGRIDELRKIHDSIEAFVKKIDEVNESRIKRIVKIYESMKPAEAARRMEKLDEDMAVMILATMKEKKAAKILALVELDRSVRLSQLLKLRRR